MSEWLERIKDTKYTFLETSDTDLKSDMIRLITEVERLRDLEEGLRLNIKIKQEGIDFLKQENERYREALEKALNAEEQTLEGYESEVYKILTKALESGNE